MTQVTTEDYRVGARVVFNPAYKEQYKSNINCSRYFDCVGTLLHDDTYAKVRWDGFSVNEEEIFSKYLICYAEDYYVLESIIDRITNMIGND